MKKQICDLELCLLSAPLPPPPPPPPPPLPAAAHHSPASSTTTIRSRDQRSMTNPQQLTIFYEGQVCVCDVTEIQARSIICQANREMDQKLEIKTHQPQLRSPGLSMKRSLQRFLQKRKRRIQSSFPFQRQN